MYYNKKEGRCKPPFYILLLLDLTSKFENNIPFEGEINYTYNFTTLKQEPIFDIHESNATKHSLEIEYDINDIDHLKEALDGKAGTIIIK